MGVKPGIGAVIFDLDGTLVSSSLNFAAIREELGCGENEDILEFITSLKGSMRANAEAIVLRHEMADARSVSLLPGVRELLLELTKKKIKTAIVTRNSRDATYQKLEQVQLSFDRVLTRECAPAKPNPSALLQLCSEWRLKTDEAIYVGDYLYDLLAAENASMHSCLYVQNETPSYANKAGFVCRDYMRFSDQLNDYLSSR
jgi:HAD superfamily hydrolase (TIGR01509 family)